MMAPTLIQGHLGEDTLPELLQFICSLDRTGQLVVECSRPRRSAAIYIARGRVVHACYPPFEGEAALWAVLAWQEGRYAFIADAAPERTSITGELHPLLIEGMRRSDERRRILARLPPASSVLHPEHDGDLLAQVLLNRDQWRLYEAIDGLRTVADLLRIADPDELVAAQDLALLIDQRLARLEPAEDFLAEVVAIRQGDPAAAAACPDLTRVDQDLLALADGHRSLADCALAIGIDGVPMVSSCRRLMAMGLLRIVAGLAAFHRYIR